MKIINMEHIVKVSGARISNNPFIWIPPAERSGPSAEQIEFWGPEGIPGLGMGHGGRENWLPPAPSKK